MTRRDKETLGVAGILLGLGLIGWAASSAAAEQERRRREEEARQRAAHLAALYAFAARMLGLAARLRGVTPPTLIEWPNTQNAGSNGSVILLDLEWLGQLLSRYCDAAVCQTAIALGLMGHELAHHLAGDAIHGGDPHQMELRADWWAGWTLGRAGVSQEDFERVIFDLSSIEDTGRSHPNRDRRSAAIREGYAAAALSAAA